MSPAAQYIALVDDRHGISSVGRIKTHPKRSCFFSEALVLLKNAKYLSIVVIADWET